MSLLPFSLSPSLLHKGLLSPRSCMFSCLYHRVTLTQLDIRLLAVQGEPGVCCYKEDHLRTLYVYMYQGNTALIFINVSFDYHHNLDDDDDVHSLSTCFSLTIGQHEKGDTTSHIIDQNMCVQQAKKLLLTCIAVSIYLLTLYFNTAKRHCDKRKRHLQHWLLLLSWLLFCC